MNEFNDKRFDDDDEIKRIQEQIDRDLAPAEPEVDFELEVKPSYSYAGEEVPEASVPPVPPTAPVAPPPSQFYRETVKSSSGKNKFKRAVALVCIASVLGGSIMGLCIGIGGKFATNVLIPRFNGDVNNEMSITDIPFSFKDEVSVSKPQIALENGEGYAAPDVISMVEPSVVGVTSIVQNAAASYFFSQPYEQEGQGSGIIFFENNEKVYIATNYHVIGGANAVKISVQGCDPVSATLVGRDAQSDLAVISVLKKDLVAAGINNVTIATFGDSETTQVGETVLAIGNALGEGNTATRGIISAKNKEINVQDRVLTVIQTDAAINPGNSGGPLVDMSGRIIGINTAKLSQSSVEGMGYSITSNIAKPIIDELMNQTSRPMLGVRGDDITQEFADQYNLPSMGVLVAEVVEGSAAQKAGIKRFDVITGLNGETVLNFEQLTEAIRACAVGDEVEVKIIRDGKTPMTIKAILMENTSTSF